MSVQSSIEIHTDIAQNNQSLVLGHLTGKICHVQVTSVLGNEKKSRGSLS